MKKKIKKNLSTLLLACCIFSSQTIPSSTVSAHKEGAIAFVGKGDVQKGAFIEQICLMNVSDNDNIGCNVNAMYNNETVDLNILNTSPLETDNFKVNFKNNYSKSNLIVLTYNANNVQNEDNLKNVIKFGYDNVKDSYNGKLVVLGLKWEQIKDNTNTYPVNNIVTERVAKEIFGEEKFAFSAIISNDMFINYNICNFINNLCKFTSELTNKIPDHEPLSPIIIRKSKSFSCDGLKHF